MIDSRVVEKWQAETANSVKKRNK